MSELINTQSQNGSDLFAGDFPRVVKPVTIAAGQDLAAGTVLGKITKGAATSVAKTGGNTGTGSLTLDSTTPIIANAQAGGYTAKCITAATNGGIFRVTDPKGNVLGDVAVGSTFSDQIKFALADGETDFVVGDGFDITIAAGSGYYKAYDDDNIDGSEKAVALLAEDVDATDGAIPGGAYFAGCFNEDALTGFDEAARTDFEGTPIFFGTIV